MDIRIEHHRNRLLSLRKLPISLYVEMHDLLFLMSLRNGDYNYEETLNYIASLGNTKQNSNRRIQAVQIKIDETVDNFFRRTKPLFNYLSQMYPHFGKETLQKIYWHLFTGHYSEENKCTWRLICRRGNCNITNKVKLI